MLDKKSPKRSPRRTVRRKKSRSKSNQQTATTFFSSSVPSSPSLSLPFVSTLTAPTQPVIIQTCQNLPDPNRTTNQGCDPGFRREGNCCLPLSESQKKIVELIQKSKYETTFDNWSKEQNLGSLVNTLASENQTPSEKVYILLLLESMKKILIQKFEAFQRFVLQLGEIVFTSASTSKEIQDVNDQADKEIDEIANGISSSPSNDKKSISVVQTLISAITKVLQTLWNLAKNITSKILWIFWKLAKFLFRVGWSLGAWILSNPTTSRYLALIGLRLKNELCKQISIELGYIEIKSGVKLFVNNASEMTENAKSIVWQASLTVASKFADSQAFNSLFTLFGSLFSLPLSILNILPVASPFFDVLSGVFFSVLKETARESVKISMFQTEVSEAWKLISEIFDVRNCIKPVVISKEREEQRWINQLNRLSDEQYSVQWLKDQGVQIPSDATEQEKLQFELNKAKEQAKNAPCPFKQNAPSVTPSDSSTPTITDFVAAFKSFL